MLLAIIILEVQPVSIVFGDSLDTHSSSYDFITLDIPNSSGQIGVTVLRDINDRGERVGTIQAGSSFNFLIDKIFNKSDIQCTKTNKLPTIPDVALSINNRGELAGICHTLPDPNGVTIHGFFRDRNGRYVLLDFPGATLTEAIGFNNDGQVVGDYRDSSGRFHVFLG